MNKSPENTKAAKTSGKRNAFLAIAAAILAVFFFLPPSEGLSHEALCAIGIFFASLTMWIGVSIDWPSLISLLLIGLLPSYGFSKMLSGSFGNSTVAFLMFTFMLVYPLSRTNFVRRVTVAFITNPIASRGPWAFTAFLFAAVTVLGLFISPSVLFVAFMPFLEDICGVLGIEKGSRAGNMLMLGTAFCISLSSGMTPIGHVWPTLAMGAYTSAFGSQIDQFQYMAFGIPTGIVLVAALILVFRFLMKPEGMDRIDPRKASALKGTIPPADSSEKIILATMALVVFLWIGPTLLKGVLPGFYTKVNGLTTAFPPLLGCIILFLARPAGRQILEFREASTKGVMWGAVLMTAAATIVGATLTNADLGISAWLSSVMSPLAGRLTPGLLVLFFVTWAVVETNFSSNIVTTTVVSSVVIAVLSALPAGTLSIPAAVCMVGFSAGICNMTPAGQSTINTVAIGSGWTDARSMFVWGAVFSVLAVLAISFIGYPIAAAVM
ncbi:MAG: anion permease [Firmicutes bacterium]|nr:anion permease [Bacillota bacterium]